jgi:hypothetical protein
MKTPNTNLEAIKAELAELQNKCAIALLAGEMSGEQFDAALDEIAVVQMKLLIEEHA